MQDRQVTDIVCVVGFNQIPTTLVCDRQTHADIVVEVSAVRVVAIGGNLAQGVRRRRYPRNVTAGRLVVARAQRYT